MPDTPLGTFYRSTDQCFWFIDAVNSTDLVPEEDWVGVFSPSTGEFVGAQILHSPEITTYTDIPGMGNNGENETSGYMNVGEIPVFKVYQASTGLVLDAQVENVNPFVNNSTHVAGKITLTASTPECSCECLPGGNCGFCTAAMNADDPEWMCGTGAGATWCSWECS